MKESWNEIDGSGLSRPDSMEEGLQFLEYEAWAERNAADHAVAILRRLAAESGSRPVAVSGLSERTRKWWVDPDRGHLVGHDLCWVCYSMLVHAEPSLPRLRVCRFCWAEDRWWADRIGRLHILPVFDWPVPPDRGRLRIPRRLVLQLADAWSGVGRLDEWRRSSVQMAYGWMGGTGPITLVEWQRNLTCGEARSRACWTSYVEGNFPGVIEGIRGVSLV